MIEASVAAGVSRIVAISAPRTPQGAVPAAVVAAARQFEALLARLGAERVVVLRTLEVMDPLSADTQATVRQLLRGDGGGGHGDPFQGVALADLAVAVTAAAVVKEVAGREFDIVARQAVARRSMGQEVERLARLLTNPDLTEVSARPSYGVETALLDARPAARALHVAPVETVWTMLAKTVQELVRQACVSGDLPPKVPPMPRVHEALETGALPLAGKQVVLTGITHPVGRAAAEMLLRLGADVTGVARSAEAAAGVGPSGWQKRVRRGSGCVCAMRVWRRKPGARTAPMVAIPAICIWKPPISVIWMC